MANRGKHIIWDWNGTLLNDAHLSLDITNRHMRENGLTEITLDQYRDIFTLPVEDFYRRVEFDFQRTPLTVLQRSFHDEYESRRREVSLHDGIERILEDLTSKNVSHSILSMHPAAMLMEMVSELDLHGRFTEIVGADDHFGRSKVAAGKLWMNETQREGPSTVMVGDTTHDFEVARELDVGCILVAHGYQSAKVLLKCGVPVVDSVPALRAALHEYFEEEHAG